MIVTNERCFFCESISNFKIDDDALLLREATCEKCGASIRNNDVYQIASTGFKDLSELTILNASAWGAIHSKFTNILNKSRGSYYCSEYFDNVNNGEYNDNGILCVNLCNIPFEDNTFDLIITEDILEHIQDAHAAFTDIGRVLKRGGIHVFSVPVNESTATRFRTAEYLPVHHADGLREEGALVYYEYGTDLCNFSKTKYTCTSKKACTFFTNLKRLLI